MDSPNLLPTRDVSKVMPNKTTQATTGQGCAVSLPCPAKKAPLGFRAESPLEVVALSVRMLINLIIDGIGSLVLCRSSKGKVTLRFKPQNPLDVAAFCACGVVSLYAHGVQHFSNAVDFAFLHTLGQKPYSVTLDDHRQLMFCTTAFVCHVSPCLIMTWSTSATLWTAQFLHSLGQ